MVSTSSFGNHIHVVTKSSNFYAAVLLAERNMECCVLDMFFVVLQS